MPYSRFTYYSLWKIYQTNINGEDITGGYFKSRFGAGIANDKQSKDNTKKLITNQYLNIGLILAPLDTDLDLLAREELR